MDDLGCSEIFELAAPLAIGVVEFWILGLNGSKT